MIYGSNQATADSLRTFVGGQLQDERRQPAADG